MSTIFCCNSIQPYRPFFLIHDDKFNSFMKWAKYPRYACCDSSTNDGERCSGHPSFVVQLVRQVNFGPLESKRYFAVKDDQGSDFFEVSERDLIQANYQKLNAYKNWKCDVHNKFFEVNVYQKDPVNLHHWRANVARPAGEIDL